MSKRSRLSHPFLKQDSWTLWEWWLLATMMGVILAVGIAVISSAIANNFGPVGTVVMLHLMGALEGVVLGFTQWLVLRRYVKHIGWWVFATGVGSLIAWLIGVKFMVALALVSFTNTMTTTTLWALQQAVFWMGAWVGTILGIAQWLVLRSHVHKGVGWVLANALAWGLGLLVAFMSVTWTKPEGLTIETVVVNIATGAATGAIVGSITGIALVWFLKPRLLRHHPSQQQSQQKL
jgi:hypothetical protein